MITSDSFTQDETILSLHGKIRRIKELEISLDDLLEPGVSSWELRRRARAHHRAYRALKLSALAEDRREKLQKEARKKESVRIEALIRDTARKNRLFCDERCDVDYVLNRLVCFGSLINILDNKIIRAFSHIEIYIEIYDDHDQPFECQGLVDAEAWLCLVEKHAGC